ncbi:MAG: flavodoxin domain-containing protein [Gorillibacterium sp.]|nr:flavodoxin domain-containing protein [Gorillibacterium sp.]
MAFIKTLIVYASKHGSAEKCAVSLSGKIKGTVELCNLKKDNVGNLGQYDQVIIGGSIYMGRIQKELTAFCTRAGAELLDKRIGLYICCMKEGQDAVVQLERSFSKELLDKAIVKETFGGELNLGKMSFFERFIVKKVAKVEKDTTFFLAENINRFVQNMNRTDTIIVS